MTRRIQIILFLFLGALAANYGVHGSMEREVIDLWPLIDTKTHTENPPVAIAEYYAHYMKNTENNLERLINMNPALDKLMEKAKGLLQVRLLQWADVIGQMALIDQQLYKYAKKAQLEIEEESDMLMDYVTWVVSHDHTAVTGLVEEMKRLVTPLFTSQGTLQLAVQFMEEDSDVCDLQMSPHQLIYDMYNTIALTEIKGYAMMQFSWMLLRIYGRGNFTQEASLTRQRYTERTGQTATAARAALASAKRDLYRCDPPVHTSATYAEVTRLLQGYIENEVDLNSDGTCRENCAFYTLAQNQGCYKDQFCAQQDKCNGRVIDCQYVDSDMWVCPSSHNSKRRYEWIEYENGRTLGRVGSCRQGTTKSLCPGGFLVALVVLALLLLPVPLRRCNPLRPLLQPPRSTIRRQQQQVDSWWRWTLTHCSYCFCLCEDEVNDAERFFSLREALADIDSNKVVTGIRLVKHGKVFHIHIYEGKLVERGFVESSEEVKAQAFDPTSPGIVEGLDYHTLIYEKRAIDLDDLDSPSGHVLTGARFRMIGAHLHFEIRATPFNYTTGKLSPEKSQWISNDNTEGSQTPRSRLELYKPDIPTRAHTSLRIDSQHDQYIEFTNSDFDADAAQSTVPFIDIQPVVPSKALNTKGATLLSGAGLYHRGAKGSGGFIAAKVITYDYSKHVKAEPPPSEFVDESETTEFVPIVN